VKLSRRDRNIIYEAIARSTLDPVECELIVMDDKAVIIHNSGSTFELSPISEFNRYRVVANVAEGSNRTFETIANAGFLVIPIREWADEVQLTAAADYWEAMRRSRETIATIERRDSANTPFTQGEQRQIAAQLQAIKNQIAEKFELSSEQMERIEERLDDATEASKRMGRKDWLIYFLGTITALIITATVTGGVGEQISIMVIHGLIHLFTGGSEPPRILA